MPDSPTSTADERHPCSTTCSDGVATVTLNRPDAMNALDTADQGALLRDPCARPPRTTTVRAVRPDRHRPGVLRRAGPARAHRDLLQSRRRVAVAHGAGALHPDRDCLATMAKPVVAAVNGVAAGAGASFAFACDFRIAGRHRRLQHRVRRRRALLRLRLVLDAAPAGRHGQGQGAAAAARARSAPRRRSSSGLATQVSPPTSWPTPSPSSPARWPPARRWPTARSVVRSPTRPGTP